MAWDLSVKYIDDSQKFDARLTNTGQLQFIQGQPKLIQQVLRSVLAEANQRAYQQTANEGDPATTASVAIQNMRSKQVRAVNDGYPGLVGWNIYRAVGDDWQQLNGSQIVTNTFQDTDVTNGTLYYYGIRRVVMLNGVQVEEPNYTDIAAIMPTSNTTAQRWVLKSQCLVFPDDGLVSIWVTANTPWYESELLEDVTSVINVKTADPRHKRLRINLTDYSGRDIVVPLDQL